MVFKIGMQVMHINDLDPTRFYIVIANHSGGFSLKSSTNSLVHYDWYANQLYVPYTPMARLLYGR